MTTKQLELTIELAYNVFKCVFTLDIAGWDFFIISDDKDALNRKSMATYNDELDTIFINPLIVDIIHERGLPDFMIVPTIFSKVGHEFRHAWQKRQKDYQEDFKNRILLVDDEEGYRRQRIEVDAFAFEECVLKVMTGDKTLVLDLEDADDVHQLSLKLYEEYGEKIEKEVQELEIIRI